MRLFVALALVAVTAFVAACGSSSSEKSGGGSSANKNAGNPNVGKKGGKLEQLGSTDVDFLDPGETYYTAGYQVAYSIHRPLYSFKPGDTSAVPDLAESAQVVSGD